MECLNSDKTESSSVLKIYGDLLSPVAIFVLGSEVEINVCFWALL